MRLLSGLLLSIVAVVLLAVPAARAQTSGPLYVLRFIEVAPGAQKQATDLLKPLADASRKEGALRFDLLQRTSPATQFVIYESWKDQAALDAHMAADHTKHFNDAVASLLLAPIDDRPCIATDAAPPQALAAGSSVVITHVDVGPPNRDKTIDILKGVAAATRKENGNLAFDALQQTARTNHFEVVEVWKDQAAEDAHEVNAATKAYRATLTPLIGARYDRRWYAPL